MTQPTDAAPAAPLAAVRLSEVLSALSHALDLTEGQPPGHTLRSCAIGMRLAEETGVDAADRHALYYALLLKDAGCSSNAARFASLFGTADGDAKYRMKLTDWHRPVRLAVRTAATAGRGRGLRAKIVHFRAIATTENVTRDLIEIRCDRGASIARGLGFPDGTAEAIRHLDEHWCGRGYPDGRRGEEIPPLARIACLAQCVEIFHARDGVRGALRVARQRRGTWFEPELVDALLRWADDRDWWAALHGPALEARVAAIEPEDRRRHVDDDGLDEVCRAFADIVDAKSPFTFRHSANVAGFARRAGAATGLDAAGLRRLYRAGLLHDVGKLGVSSRILEKPGRLDDGERREVERHPLHTWEILSRVTAFASFARMAALHHEKLDGSGYPWGVPGEALEPAARLLAVADVYEALTADRPYRAGMTRDEALGILRRDAPARLCRDAVDALAACTEPGGRD